MSPWCLDSFVFCLWYLLHDSNLYLESSALLPPISKWHSYTCTYHMDTNCAPLFTDLSVSDVSLKKSINMTECNSTILSRVTLQYRINGNWYDSFFHIIGCLHCAFFITVCEQFTINFAVFFIFLSSYCFFDIISTDCFLCSFLCHKLTQKV